MYEKEGLPDDAEAGNDKEKEEIRAERHVSGSQPALPVAAAVTTSSSYTGLTMPVADVTSLHSEA